MKHLIILVSLFYFSSCCSAKTVNESQSKNNNEIVEIVKTETHKPEDEPKQAIENQTLPLPPKPPKQIENQNTSIHKRWDTILKEFVSSDGKVDYLGIKGASDFDIYVDMLQDKTPEDSWSREKKLAYWINAYNALTVDLIIKNYPVKSIKDIDDPWEQRLWKFGDKWLNLNDIEHKILRKMEEPRIHFAIVCASESCPKLLNEAFTAENLESQLTKATKAFLSDKSKNEISKDNLKLSKIFKWFSKDFKQNGSLIDFLNQYTDVEISQNAKKSYKEYDWSLNE